MGSVTGGGSSPGPSPRPTPNPTPIQPASPTWAPTQPASPTPAPPVTQAPAPQPEPEPVPATPTPPQNHEGATCRVVWEQCGGVNWTGATCCDGDKVCLRQSEWYSQCVPMGYQFPSLVQAESAKREPRGLKIRRHHMKDQALIQFGSMLKRDKP